MYLVFSVVGHIFFFWWSQFLVLNTQTMMFVVCLLHFKNAFARWQHERTVSMIDGCNPFHVWWCHLVNVLMCNYFVFYEVLAASWREVFWFFISFVILLNKKLLSFTFKTKWLANLWASYFSRYPVYKEVHCCVAPDNKFLVITADFTIQYYDVWGFCNISRPLIFAIFCRSRNSRN